MPTLSNLTDTAALELVDGATVGTANLKPVRDARAHPCKKPEGQQRPADRQETEDRIGVFWRSSTEYRRPHRLDQVIERIQSHNKTEMHRQCLRPVHDWCHKKQTLQDIAD